MTIEKDFQINKIKILLQTNTKTEKTKENQILVQSIMEDMIQETSVK